MSRRRGRWRCFVDQDSTRRGSREGKEKTVTGTVDTVRNDGLAGKSAGQRRVGWKEDIRGCHGSETERVMLGVGATVAIDRLHSDGTCDLQVWEDRLRVLKASLRPLMPLPAMLKSNTGPKHRRETFGPVSLGYNER